MAPLLLLTPEQAQRNKELFERAPAHLPPPGSLKHAPPQVELLSVSSEDTASTLAVGNATIKSGYPPPPNTTIFSNPEYHEHVISTFFTTAMTAVGYVPNSPATPAEEEAAAFSKFLGELSRYGSYLPIELSKSDSYEHASSDCAPLLKTISAFIEAVETLVGAKNASDVATGVTNIITSAIESMGSSSSEKVEKTLYSVYRVNGDVVNKPYPVGTIFWSSVSMERHTSGKSTVERQKIEMRSYSYMILSPVVVANAAALGSATPIPVAQFVESVNKNVPV